MTETCANCQKQFSPQGYTQHVKHCVPPAANLQALKPVAMWFFEPWMAVFSFLSKILAWMCAVYVLVATYRAIPSDPMAAFHALKMPAMIWCEGKTNGQGQQAMVCWPTYLRDPMDTLV